MIKNIMCSGCGDVVCGSVETTSTGGKLLGDKLYGFLCSGCAADAEKTRKAGRQMLENVKAKFFNQDLLSPAERDLVLGRLFRR